MQQLKARRGVKASELFNLRGGALNSDVNTARPSRALASTSLIPSSPMNALRYIVWEC